jgi:hypothetical protein
MGRGYSVVEEMRNAYRSLVRKTEGKSPLGTPGHRSEYNLKLILKK